MRRVPVEDSLTRAPPRSSRSPAAARAAAFDNARRASTPARWRRYSAVAWMSVAGSSSPAAAAATAANSASDGTSPAVCAPAATSTGTSPTLMKTRRDGPQRPSSPIDVTAATPTIA